MASTISFYFSTQALARPKGNTPRNPRKPCPKSNSNPKRRTSSTSSDLPPPPLISFAAGNEATTYTRLPPKDDFSLSSPEYAFQPPAEVKLSESRIANRKSSDVVSEKEIVESTEKSGELDFGSEKFELFEVDSDSEYDDDDDEDGEEVYGVEGDEVLRFGGEEIEGEEVKEKEKGVPAVMRCFDR